MHGSFFQLLGLCQRAGKVVSGDQAVRENLNKGKVKLLLVATNTSERIKKDYLRVAELRKVPVSSAFTKEELGQAMGKSPRAAVAILDESFARGIAGLLEKGEI